MLILLAISSSLLLIVIAVLAFRIQREKYQVNQALVVLEDIAKGNLDRRIIASEDTTTAAICYKVNEIVSSLKGELTDLRQTEKEYRQLITSLSHDIRTPLTSLMGYLDAVNEEVVTGQEKSEYLVLSSSKAAELKHYIDMLFEWLKLESGERSYFFEKIDLYEELRETMADWIIRIEQKEMAYTIEIPSESTICKLDRTAFRRIIDNLMENCLDHSQAEKLFISAYETTEHLIIMVKDNGIGVAEEQLPFLFDSLYKVSDSRNTKGSGLGLAIVKELMKAHDGIVTAVSEEAAGLTITLTFLKIE